MISKKEEEEEFLMVELIFKWRRVKFWIEIDS